MCDFNGNKIAFQFLSCDLDPGPMTLIYELDLEGFPITTDIYSVDRLALYKSDYYYYYYYYYYILNIPTTKNEACRLILSEVRAQNRTQRRTDRDANEHIIVTLQLQVVKYVATVTVIWWQKAPWLTKGHITLESLRRKFLENDGRRFW